MYLSREVLLASIVFVFQHVRADLAYDRAKTLTRRQAGGDLSFCFGKNSICEIQNNLNDECDAFDNDDGDQIPYYKCLCGNGFVAVQQSCHWCQQVYNLGDTDMQDIYEGYCSSASVTIAPIPTTVIALEASYNSTYTGVVPGKSAKTTASATTTDGKTEPSSNSASKTSLMKEDTSTHPTTYFGGTTGVYTRSGGGGGGSKTTADSNQADSTSTPSTPSSSLRSGGDTTDGAPGLNTRLAVVQSFLVFGLGLSVLSLI